MRSWSHTYDIDFTIAVTCKCVLSNFSKPPSNLLQRHVHFKDVDVLNANLVYQTLEEDLHITCENWALYWTAGLFASQRSRFVASVRRIDTRTRMRLTPWTSALWYPLGCLGDEEAISVNFRFAGRVSTFRGPSHSSIGTDRRSSGVRSQYSCRDLQNVERMNFSEYLMNSKHLAKEQLFLIVYVHFHELQRAMMIIFDKDNIYLYRCLYF